MGIPLKTIPIFVVNLPQSIEKRKHIRALCDKYRLNPEFIDAVDGRLLSDEEVAKISPKEQTIKNIGRRLTKGEVGCALSHKLIYQKIVDNNIKAALILEDDAKFNQDFINFISAVGANNFKDLDIILMGHNNQRRPICSWQDKIKIKKYALKKPLEIIFGTHGYCITNKGAKKMLSNIGQITLPIDHYTGDVQYVNLRLLHPQVVLINETMASLSELESDRNAMRDKYPIQKTLKMKILNLFNAYKITINIKYVIKYIWLHIPYLKYKR
ncbi:MAG: glycosyltransferase family 25 protein [Candidatus Thioglobus sp.]|uniref:glycosyltransferase family 25 protein n=1 Tax=Candidatus Thioglobus sp. TaxID=2026721 RepID=UPI00263501A0|nr:glycosyltransferase family 25 protein [Candidatus Thioglobus sp.]MDC9727543.1 glycosyltransferase family 25 protein [Candidatus Thioglobus sp.]